MRSAIASIAIAVVAAACTSQTSDGPHELVLTVSGQNGNASMRREEVFSPALVSREACMTAMEKLLDAPLVNPNVKIVSRTADSRTETAGPVTLTSSFRCRFNMAAKPPFAETPGSPSTPAQEPVATQPAISVTPSVPPATPQTDEAAERVYRELQKMERAREGR
jgi:hypothetical protein